MYNKLRIILFGVLLLSTLVFTSIVSPRVLAAPTQAANVFVCLRYTSYEADSLVYRYQLLNRGSADVTVTAIHIGVFGPNVSSRQIMPTNLDTIPGRLNLLVPSNTITSMMTNSIYVGNVKESSFQYAISSVTWSNGRSAEFTHQNNGAGWTNDAACGSGS